MTDEKRVLYEQVTGDGEPWEVLLLEVVSRRFQSRGKGIGARDFCLCQNMAIESFADVSAGEITLHFKLSHVDSEKGKCVMVTTESFQGGAGPSYPK